MEHLATTPPVIQMEADILKTRLSVFFVCWSCTTINVKLGDLIWQAPWCLFIKEEINALEMSPSARIQSVTELKPVIMKCLWH